MNKAPIVIFCTVTLLSAVLLGKRALYPFSYCAAKERALSQQEIIDSAISYALQKYPPTLIRSEPGKIIYYRPPNSAPYQDIKAFKKLNPNCCSVGSRGSEGEQASLIDRISGRVTAIVHMNYVVRFIDEAGVARSGTAEEYVAVSKCGQAGQEY